MAEPSKDPIYDTVLEVERGGHHVTTGNHHPVHEHHWQSVERFATTRACTRPAAVCPHAPQRQRLRRPALALPRGARFTQERRDRDLSCDSNLPDVTPVEDGWRESS